MTRTTAREMAMHFSYELAYTDKDADEMLSDRFQEEYYPTLKEECSLYSEMPDEKQMKYLHTVVRGVYEHAYELDQYIQKYSRGWEFARISKAAVAIMRLCMFEILYVPDIPTAVSVNEALNLAKKYDELETAPFINGILSSFIKGEALDS